MDNRLKTAILLASLTGLLLAIGYLVGGIGGLTIAFIVAFLMNFLSYWFSDKIVLALYGAKELPKESSIYNIVKEVASDAKIPTPRVYEVNSRNPNAFATGRGPGSSAIAVTTGIEEILSDRELRAVIAHEMSHIKNRDTLVATIAATIAGTIAYVAMMARYAALFGGGSSDRNDNLLEILALAIVAPLVATILQLAISRQREYLADATGAKMIHDPEALADALLKIEQGTKAFPMQGNPATASLFIANPFRQMSLFTLFSTHPPIKDRVARLRQMR